MKNKSVKNSRPVAIDLFSGAGGFSLGLEAAGFEIALSVDIDPIHCAVHKFNFPVTKTLCKNICDLSVKELSRQLETIGVNSLDLIVGGAPCQGFSSIGKQLIEDPRNELIFEFARIIKGLKPKYFIFENVSNIVKGKNKQLLEKFREYLSKCGYHLREDIFNAADFGVAQKRLRYFLIGWLKDMPSIENMPKLSANPQEWIGASDVLADLLEIPVHIGVDYGIHHSKLNYHRERQNFSLMSSDEYRLCHRRKFVEPLIYGHIGSRHTKKSVDKFEKTLPGTREKTSRFFKLHTERPTNTLRAGTDRNRGAHTAPRPIHYLKPRCISIREGARLHSYPDWFQFHRTI